MKIKLLLGLIIVGIFVASCESEYDKQLSKAKELVDQEVELEASIPLESQHSDYLNQSLEDVKETIMFHAHLSGNKELFLEELRNYRSGIVTQEPAQDLLITKYP